MPFVCATDVSIEIASTKVPIRTRGDGHWKKYTYQDITFTITLSGLLKFDDGNWTGWDMLDNQFNFSHVLIRCSFLDDQGNIRTVQGYVMIETSTISYSPGQLVKDDFQMQGNGSLIIFDGYIPCDSLITGITVTGQTASDGIVHISYTFTGPAYQVKYRIDDTGDYVYATAGPTIDVPGLPNANHTVEIIPVCQNGYEGTGRVERFQVTHAETCGSSIDSITVDTTAFTITNTHSGAATQMRYRIDGGAWVNALIAATISIAFIDPGNHTVEMVPVCSNGVEGTGRTQAFTIVSQPAMSKINWSITPLGNYDTLYIYQNGVLIVNDNTTSSGFFMAPVGASIRTVLYSPNHFGNPPRDVRLRIDDTVGVRFDQTAVVFTLSHTFDFTVTANGNEFHIDATIIHH